MMEDKTETLTRCVCCGNVIIVNGEVGEYEVCESCVVTEDRKGEVGKDGGE